MRVKPFLIDGVIGNSKMLATYSNKGELLRLWWPHIDFPQHVEEVTEGIFIKTRTKEIAWRNDEDFIHEQSYVGNGAVLETKSVNNSLQVEINSMDFAPMNEKDILIKRYTIKNNGSESIEGSFIYYSNMAICENERYNSTLFDYSEDALLHYRHEYFIATGCSENINGFATTDAKKDCKGGKLKGINLSNESEGALQLDFSLKANEEFAFDIFLAFAVNRKENAFELLKKAKNTGAKTYLESTNLYWSEYLLKGDIGIKDEKVREIYNKSLMVFKLASDEATGGLIAAPEFDEHRLKCGGYSYCWGRDAAYIATAIEKAGYSDMVDKFYKWSISTQDKNGAWDQRHFMQGHLAPCWGIQIDEGASLIWGMWQHYEATKDENFLNYVYENVKIGTEYIYNYFDDTTNMPKESKDLWEERSSQAVYSSAAVYSALVAASKFAAKKGDTDLEIKYIKRSVELKKSIDNLMWNKEKQTFYRGIKLHVSQEKYDSLELNSRMLTTDTKGYNTYIQMYDDIIDISLIGLCYPFDLYDVNDEKMKKTALAIEKYCTSPEVGGILRYEDDHYIGGNPWILCTLWLAIYYAKINDAQKAKKYFDWATENATNLNLLPEQIDKNTGKTAWVVPLTWSHAMYVLATLELRKFDIF